MLQNLNHFYKTYSKIFLQDQGCFDAHSFLKSNATDLSIKYTCLKLVQSTEISIDTKKTKLPKKLLPSYYFIRQINIVNIAQIKIDIYSSEL